MCSMLIRSRLWWMVFLVISVSAKAAPLVIPSPTPVEKPWSIDWDTKYQFSLHGSNDANKNSSVVSTATFGYVASPTFKLKGVIGGIQAIRPSLDFRVVNPEFRGFLLLSDAKKPLRFYIGPTLVLPFGSDARDESLIFGGGVGARMLLDLKKGSDSGFRGYYDLTFNKNFHQYETSVFAQVNNQLALNHAFYMEYNFDPQWDVNANFSFSSLWNYFGVLSNNYSVEQVLEYKASEMVTLYLSHIRGGDFLSPNGQNYSFGIFDKDSSRLSLGMVLSF